MKGGGDESCFGGHIQGSGVRLRPVVGLTWELLSLAGDRGDSSSLVEGMLMDPS